MSDGTQKTSKLPATIELPSGGKVWFRDLDEQPLTGKDLRRWRTVLNELGRGNYVIRSAELLLAMFVVRWEIPDRPRLPLPSEDPKITDLLSAEDVQEIEDALEPMIDVLNGVANRKRNTGDTGPGSPTPPSSE